MRFGFLVIFFCGFSVINSHAQIPTVNVDAPTNGIFSELEQQTIRARLVPGNNEFTIQMAIDLPTQYFGKQTVDFSFWNLDTAIVKWNSESLSIADRFFQSATTMQLATHQLLINYEMRYHLYSFISANQYTGRSRQFAPILESSGLILQDNTITGIKNINLSSEISPILAGGEWTFKYNKNRSKIMISIRVSGGLGLSMQNQLINNYYPMMNTGFLVRF